MATAEVTHTRTLDDSSPGSTTYERLIHVEGATSRSDAIWVAERAAGIGETRFMSAHDRGAGTWDIRFEILRYW